MSGLGELLFDRIRREGPLPVEEYMRLCLAHPEHGYYRSQTAIGAAGDFITAPEISQIFGELVGLWAAALWTQMGRPSPLRLVELGPGRGTLMADALRAVARVAGGFRAALDLHLVEINPGLRQQQHAALAAAQPSWHDRLDTVPPGPLIVIANEFFDALPVRQIVRAGDGWHERVVACRDGRLAFAAGASTASPDIAADAGAVLETSPAGEAWMQGIAARIVAHGGGALVVDYGPAVRAPGDTLQAVRGHQPVSPLEEPGLCDLTAHVDFTGLAAAGRAAGAAAFGPIPQSAFLRRLGIAARAATLLQAATPDQARVLEGSVRRLIEPAEMGTLFKALAVASPDVGTPPGFDAQT
ncbi:MAG TPA: SAM-dependent methyltransferase [Alphaproteobacteria bacterium]